MNNRSILKKFGIKENENLTRSQGQFKMNPHPSEQDFDMTNYKLVQKRKFNMNKDNMLTEENEEMYQTDLFSGDVEEKTAEVAFSLHVVYISEDGEILDDMDSDKAQNFTITYTTKEDLIEKLKKEVTKKYNVKLEDLEVRDDNLFDSEEISFESSFTRKDYTEIYIWNFQLYRDNDKGLFETDISPEKRSYDELDAKERHTYKNSKARKSLDQEYDLLDKAYDSKYESILSNFGIKKEEKLNVAKFLQSNSDLINYEYLKDMYAEPEGEFKSFNSEDLFTDEASKYLSKEQMEAISNKMTIALHSLREELENSGEDQPTLIKWYKNTNNILREISRLLQNDSEVIEYNSREIRKEDVMVPRKKYARIMYNIDTYSKNNKGEYTHLDSSDQETSTITYTTEKDLISQIEDKIPKYYGYSSEEFILKDFWLNDFENEMEVVLTKEDTNEEGEEILEKLNVTVYDPDGESIFDELLDYNSDEFPEEYYDNFEESKEHPGFEKTAEHMAHQQHIPYKNARAELAAAAHNASNAARKLNPNINKVKGETMLNKLENNTRNMYKSESKKIQNKEKSLTKKQCMSEKYGDDWNGEEFVQEKPVRTAAGEVVKKEPTEKVKKQWAEKPVAKIKNPGKSASLPLKVMLRGALDADIKEDKNGDLLISSMEYFEPESLARGIKSLIVKSKEPRIKEVADSIEVEAIPMHGLSRDELRKMNREGNKMENDNKLTESYIRECIVSGKIVSLKALNGLKSLKKEGSDGEETTDNTGGNIRIVPGNAYIVFEKGSYNNVSRRKEVTRGIALNVFGKKCIINHKPYNIQDYYFLPLDSN